MSTFTSPLCTDAVTHERVIGITAAWLHEEPCLPEGLLPESREELVQVVLTLGLMTATFLKLWGAETGINPSVLLQDIALGRLADPA